MNVQPPSNPVSENELRESRQQTHRALEAANIVAFTWDIKNDVVHLLNSGVESIPNAEGETLADVAKRLYEPDRARFLENLKKSIANPQETYRAEYRLQLPDEKVIWISETGRFETDENGEAVRLTAISAEITERKIAEEQLRASEARLHLGVEVAGFAICQLDYATDLAHLSKEAALLYGVGNQAMTVPRKELHALFHPDDAPLIAKNIAESMIPEGEGWFSSEHRLVRRDGSVRWVTVRKQVFFDRTVDPPRPTIGILVGQDVTDRKEVENKIRESEERYRALVTAAAQVEWIAAADGRFIERQPTWEEFTGQPFEEYRDNGWTAVLHPDDREQTLAVWQKAIAEKSFYMMENRLRRRDGVYRWMSVRAVPILDERGEIREWVGSNTDITERKTDELNARMMFRVGELIREATDVEPLLGSISECLGERLGAAHCLFNEIDLQNNLATVYREYARDRKQCYVGTTSTENYSLVTKAQLEKGQTVVVADTENDERTAAWFEKSYRKEGIRAYISYPLMRDGAWTATLWISSDKPHPWQEWEILLIQTVAERTWLAAEKLRSEKKMRESEERFRLLTENLDSVFWIFNWENQRGEYVSPSYSRMYGEKQAQLVAGDLSKWTNMVHPEDRERMEQDFAAIETTGKYESVYRIILPDGSVRWRHSKGSPIRDETGKILRVVGVTEDITDRRLAEIQIRESEERLRLATDVADMFSWENDFVLNKLKWSDNAAKILGIAPEKLSPAPEDALFFVAPDEKDRILEIFEQAMREGRNNYTSEFRGIDGQYWLAHSSVIRDEHGNVLKVVGVTQNITERRISEKRIQTANYRFQIAEAAAKSFNYEWNLKNGVVTRSKSIRRVLGYQRSEIPMTWEAWVDLIHPEDVVVKSKDEAFEWLFALREDTFTSEYRARHKDGHFVWLQERGLLIRDEHGELERIIGQTMDVTEQKQAHKKLLEAERRAVRDYRKLLARIAPLAQVLGTARELTTIYRTLLEFIRFEIPCEGFFVSFYDAENHLKQVKYVWTEGREIDAREMQPIPLFKGQGVNSRAIREGKTVISTRDLENMSGNFQVVSENAQRSVETIVTPMIVMGRVVGTLEVQNHTEKYASEHVVALEMAANLAAVAIENVRLINLESEARAAAEEANRAKDEFLAMLSHELRSPLNAMYGWTQILQVTKPDAEQTAKAIEIIARNVRLQKTLIEDLLDVSRIITGKMLLEKELVSLVSIVQAAVETARPAAEKQSIAIELNVAATKKDEIFGDKHRLEQIVSNILTNAVKFTQSGGRITITLENRDENLTLTIKDTGIGIAPELLPRIFDRFHQADGGYKRKFGGLGLGLTIVKHLTELHGGTVQAFSEGEGKGARFVIEFPAAAPADFAPQESLPAAASNMLSQNLRALDGASILIVDDDSDVLTLISFVFQEVNANVTCAYSARQALALLREHSFDLLISDLGMPEMDGFDLIKAVRTGDYSENRDLPAIALTGFVSAQDRKRVLEAGFQYHLSKPVDLNKLLANSVDLLKK